MANLAPMAKRIFQGIVLFFALYAFAFMPLGRRTALEHVRAVLTSPQARQAATELQGGATKLVQKLRGEAEQLREPPPAALRKPAPK